jgi:hypothetical protein
MECRPFEEYGLPQLVKVFSHAARNIEITGAGFELLHQGINYYDDY